MVWAARFESEFGRFFPCGDYDAFRKHLETYYTNEMPDDEKVIYSSKSDYRFRVFEKFINETGVPRQHGATLTPLQEHEWPKKFLAERWIGRLGSLVTTTNRVLAVDKRLRDVIENLEPETHQFRPITFLQPFSIPIPRRYYVMVIGQFRDSFVPDPETEGDLWKHMSYRDENGARIMTGNYLCYARSEEAFAQLSFSQSAINGAHLWRERRLKGPDFFISDALYDAIRKAKRSIPPHYRVKVG